MSEILVFKKRTIRTKSCLVLFENFSLFVNLKKYETSAKMNNRVGTVKEKIKANINSKVKFWEVAII